MGWHCASKSGTSRCVHYWNTSPCQKYQDNWRFTMYTHAIYVLAMRKSFSFCLGNMHMFMYMYICNIHVLCFSSSVLGHTTASLNPVSCMIILCTVQPSSQHRLSIQAPYVSPISIMYFSHFHIFYQNSKGSRPPLYWYWSTDYCKCIFASSVCICMVMCTWHSILATRYVHSVHEPYLRHYLCSILEKNNSTEVGNCHTTG